MTASMQMVGVAIAAVAPVVCGDSGAASDAAAPIDISGLRHSPCASDRSAGGFGVWRGASFTSVGGQVRAGVDPSRVLDTVQQMGGCSWVRAAQRFCDPPCTAGSTCGPAGACVAVPLAIDVGTINIEGLSGPASMPPRPPAFVYNFTGSLPDPGIVAGDPIRLSADGFTLLGWGSEPLTGIAARTRVETAQPLAVSWTPPTLAGPTKVELTLNVNGHGLVGSRLECVADDTGAFTIAAPMITTLLADGQSGFPTLTVRRVTTDSATFEGGCVELDVGTEVVADVDIPGLISCDDNKDCTPPATCQADLTCR